jgi:centromere protein C
LVTVRENKDGEEDWRKPKSGGKKKKKRPAAVDEEEEELEEWEAGNGVLVGTYRDYDAATETTKEDHLETGKSGTVITIFISC